MVKTGMVSKWHVHAPGYAQFINGYEKSKVTAVWDDDAKRGMEWADELGCEFYESYDDMLKHADIDAVICDAPTTAHKDLLIKAARAGKHIFTEKALCPTVAECIEVKKAVEEAGVTFAISYPQKGRPSVQFARSMVEKNAFGKITFVRIRDAHNGVSGHWLPDYWFEKADAAGGAMMDLGCHPMYLIAHILGRPKKITSVFTSPYGKPVDENAVAVMEFEDGAIGVAETGFVSAFSPQEIEIIGTEGTMLVRNEDVSFKSAVLSGGFSEFSRPELPEWKAQPIEQFIIAVDSGRGSPEGLGMDDAILLTELLENSYRAYEDGKVIEFK